MIFKTFNSDIDKWTAKIGILGKSFNELGTAINNAFKATIDNVDNFDENIGFWENLKNNLFSKNDSDKDWVKNSLGEIISKENIDSYIKELDLDSAKQKLDEIFNVEDAVKVGTTTWDKYFETQKDGKQYIIELIKNTDDLSKLEGQDLVKACNEAREAAIGHNVALEQQTLGAKATTVAMKAFAMVGNMIAMWAITKGIELVVKGLDNYVHRVEKADEATKEAIDTLESTTSEVESLDDKITDLNEQIKELDPITNEEDIEKLKLETEELNTQLAILKEKQRIASDEADKAAQKSLGMTEASHYKSEERESAYGGIEVGVAYVTKDEELLNAMEAYEEYKNKVDEANKALADMAKSGKYTKNQWNEQEQIISKYSEKMNNARSHANELRLEIGEQAQGLNGNTEASKKLLDTVNSATARYDEWLDTINGTTEALKEQANAESGITDEPNISSITQTITDLKDLNNELNNLGSAIANIDSEGKFDLGDLASIADYFLGLEDITYNIDSVNNALQTLGDGNATLEEQTDAINTLATEYLNTSGVLNKLTKENKDLMTLQLQRMGIVNAEEIVNAKLNQTYGKLIEAEEIAEQQSINLTTVTYDEINSLLTEGQISGQTSQLLAYYALQKQYCNDKVISTEGDCQNIINLAKTAGYSTEVLTKLETLKARMADPFATYEMKANVSNAIKDILNTANANMADYDFQIPQDAHNISSASSTVETFNWLETLISRIERKITNLGNIVSSVWKNWSDRNHAIVQEMSAISEEIGVQQSAYDAYMAKADSVGLSPYYQALVQNGGFLMEDITNDTLKEQIKKYQEFYEKALACSDAVSNLRNNLADMAQSRFDNIAAQFNAQISIIEHETAMLDLRLDQIEAKGYIASGSYYTELIKLEQDNIAFLQNEYSSLMGSLHEALGNGTIEQYSEQWYDMVNSINDVQEAIENADSSLIDYQNSLRQLNWDIFDKTEEYISHIHSESDFLIELMNNRELYHENGAFNDLGNAAAGLHAVKYNTYMSQADDYAKEILTIDKEIADDPYNTALMERRQELLELQQDSIKAAEDEKQSMKDLVSDGYDFMLTALQKLIDKRKDAMQSEKDLYDYQKSIAEQTMTIAQYQKQLSAFSGDDSEETQAAIQKIKVSLEEAKQNLAENEYNQWLTDQEKMLDSLYDETEEWVNQRLDNLNGIILEIIDNTNANADSIRETLAAVGENVGYALTPEMEKIWTASDGISQVVSQYGNNFSFYATTVQTVLSNIQNLILQMINTSDNTAAGDINGIKQNTAALTGSSSGTPSANSTGNSGFAASGFTGNSFWGSWFVNQKDSFDKSKLNAESSIVDRLKLRDISSDFQKRKKYYSAMGGTGTYTGSSSQNAWMIAQMKAHGFLKGGIIGNAIHSAGEDGFILARTGEGILPLEMMPEWEELISSLPKLNNMNHLLLDMPTLPHYNPAVNLAGNSGDVTLQIDGIQMYGVNNPEQFTESLVDALSNNTRIKKVLVDNTVGVSLGRNSLLSQSR